MLPRESQSPLENLNRRVNELTMDKGPKTHYQCARCKGLLQLSESLLINGCPSCGSKTLRFTTLNKEESHPTNTVPEQDFEKDSLDIIRLVQPGIYQINLSKLTGMRNTNEPLVLSAKRGIFKLSFLSDD